MVEVSLEWGVGEQSNIIRLNPRLTAESSMFVISPRLCCFSFTYGLRPLYGKNEWVSVCLQVELHHQPFNAIDMVLCYQHMSLSLSGSKSTPCADMGSGLYT